jgi:hypothetical protein
MLIQIWLPLGDQQPAAQSNTSSATASAVNSNQVTQTATQLQSGGSQVGGAGQSQTIEQNAPTTQTASAQASSEQVPASGNSSATATQESSSQTVQVAHQTGPGTQVIEQNAPATQSGDVVMTAGTGTSGIGADGWRLVSPLGRNAAQWSAPDQPNAASSPEPSRRSHSGAPRHRVPFPHDPNMPNASLGGASPTGGSPGIFAMLLLAFALTTPWWGRRRLTSAFRRLMAVVSRLERPG